MLIPADTPIYGLDIHAGYHCAHSGACCSSAWPIPVERDTHERLRGLIASAQLKIGVPERVVVHLPGAPDETPVVTALDEHGTCVFYEKDARRCAIHRQVGHDLLPVACQQFPRVSLLDGRGLFVNISHFCPTAAGMLFRAAAGSATDVEVVEAPPAFTHAFTYDPLDARGELPPLLTPAVLMSLDVYDRYERQIVAVAATPGWAPEQSVAAILRLTEALRNWTPRTKDLCGHYEDCTNAIAAHDAPASDSSASTTWKRRAEHVALVFEVTPPDVRPALARDLDDPHLAGVDARLVATAWPSFSPVIGRYLAAKAFGSWLAYQGRGVRTVAYSLVVALSLVRNLAALACAEAARPLDRGLLTRAIRSADELWMHLASREDLARRLSVVESLPAGEFLADTRAGTS